MNKKKTILIVLDGWGYREDTKDNAIAMANKPYFDKLWNNYPHSLLDASGLAVGLPDGQMGNSEVGHTTIGAGRVIYQDLVRIEKDINDSSYEEKDSFKKLFKHVKDNNSVLHVMGLLSDGGVHSHISHLFAFLKAAKNNNIEKVAIHVFTDGRDVPPQSASSYLKKLEKEIENIGVGFIASVSGRFYAMDRDKNWDRLKIAEDVIFEGKGNVCDIAPSLYVDNLYKDGKLDEHLVPFVCVDEKNNKYNFNKNDGVFFFNFRADRARQMTSKILDKVEKENICLVTMTDYGDEYNKGVIIVYPPILINTTLAKEISDNNLTQAHIAETEKFAHATYFLNGGVEDLYKGETHILVPSRKDIKTYDLAPKMSAEGIADKAIEQIRSGIDFIFINFANADMVGHTAVVDSVVEAVEEVDTQLGRVFEEGDKNDFILCITADHGNAEINIDQETGLSHTSHTNNKVPFIITEKDIKVRNNGTLADIAPTVLNILNIDIPDEMTGKSLIL